MRRFFLVLFVIVGSPTFSSAESVDLCREVSEVIKHPAEFAERKTRKIEGFGCALIPHCCGPLWETDPVCYISEIKKTRKKWKETKISQKCKTKPIKKAIRNFFAKDTHPLYVLTPGFYMAYRAYVQTTTATAAELPSDVKEKLSRLVGQAGIPFSQQQIDEARWIKSTKKRGKVLYPGTYKISGMDGITHDHLIVTGPEVDKLQGCNLYSFWAHELTHVFQNDRDGNEAFLKTYNQDQAKYEDDKEIPYEKEAYAVQTTVETNYCNLLE